MKILVKKNIKALISLFVAAISVLKKCHLENITRRTKSIQY